MSVERSYSLNVTATIKDYEKKLGEVPGVTEKEARKAALKLHQELLKGQQQARADARRAAAEAAKAWEDAGRNAADKFGNAFGGVGSAASKVAGFLDTLAPGAGEYAQALGDVGDAGEVAAAAAQGFGVSLGSVLRVAVPVTLAVGALSLAYKSYKAELDAAEAKQARALDVMRDVKGLTDKVTEAKRALAIAVGGETAETAKAEQVSEKWQEAAEAANTTLATKRRELEEALATEREYVSKGMGSHQRKVEELTAAIAVNEAEQRRNIALAKQGADAELGAAEATRLRAEAEKTLAEREAARKKTAQELLDQERERIALWNESTQAANSAASAAAEAFAKAGSDTQASAVASIRERIKAEQKLIMLRTGGDEGKRIALEEAAAIRDATTALQGQLAELQRIRDERLALAQTVSAQETAEADYRAAAVEAERATQAQIVTIRAEAAERTATLTEATNAANVNAYAQMFGNISQAAETFAGLMGKRQKKLALFLFRLHQGSAAAQAAINTAWAVSNALKDFPIPLNAAMAVTAGLAGGAQVAAILAQKPPAVNDTASPMKMTQRRTVSFGSDDIVVAARDPREVQRQAASLTGSRGDSMREEVVSVSVVDGRAIGRRILDDVALRTRTRRALAGANQAAGVRLGKEEAA
jgi:hypothetical protein